MNAWDIFFISHSEANAENNWARCLSLEPTAKRIHGVAGIDVAHKICDSISETDYFFTIDGDNFLFEKLSSINYQPTNDVTIFLAVDPVFATKSAYGAIKLWRKGTMGGDMSKGDFVLNATSAVAIERSLCLSEHRYNSTPWDAYRSAFRQCIKTIHFEPELRDLPWSKKEDRHEIQREHALNRYLNAGSSRALNSSWIVSGAKDAIDFSGDPHIINRFSDLRQYFDDRYFKAHSKNN